MAQYTHSNYNDMAHKQEEESYVTNIPVMNGCDTGSQEQVYAMHQMSQANRLDTIVHSGETSRTQAVNTAYHNDGSVETIPYNMTQAGYSGNNRADPYLLEAAIAAGRVYSLPNASFVPGPVVAQAGVSTIYDSSIIPTFESDLEIIPASGEQDYHKYVERKQNTSEAQDLKSFPVLYKPRKSYCC